MNNSSKQNIKSFDSLRHAHSVQKSSSKFETPIDVQKLILDYLKKKNLEKSLETFKKETSTFSSMHTDRNKLLTDFDKGTADSFFNNWVQFNSREDQVPIVDDPKFEFYLRVYFLIYDIHPAIKNLKTVSESKRQFFKDYLDSNGQDLAKYPELVQYFAFPYIANLKEHASFKELFTKKWVTDLRDKLDKVISANLNRVDTKLETLLMTAQSNTNIPSKQIMSQQSLNDNTAQYKEKVQELKQLNRELVSKLAQQEADSKEVMKEIHHRWGNFVQ